MLVSIVNLAYLIGATFFVLGLRQLSTPVTARKGNLLAALGMAIAIIATMVLPMAGVSNNYAWIIGGMLVGGIIGLVTAKKVQMTAMPQMVSIFNGLGGACAVVLAMIELIYFYDGRVVLGNGKLIIVLLTLLIGAVAFTGSLLAFAKLQGLVKDSQITLPKHNIINYVLLAATIGFSVYIFLGGQAIGLPMALVMLTLSLIYGFSFVAPIGGADMPVVISLLNAFTGLSAAAAGLIYNNNIMLVGGILVGAAGIILTVLMCEAMNRSLIGVLIGGFGTEDTTAQAGDNGQIAKSVTINDAAIQLFYSKSVMIVPGYGLAVAQAQKVVRELDDMLTANGVDVTYAIHPVAGRMPGHMNVLLAEADVPYPKLLDLEEANVAIHYTDMVLVVGANDVVNPAALDDPGSPVYGMPVLNVWKAKRVIVMKRGMSAGYAGIQNQLFFHEKNSMLFGDAKVSLQELLTEIKVL